MRLIDVDDLMDWSEIVPLTGDGGIDINDFDEKLKSMPTVDAVPVIRCKDCIRWRRSKSDITAKVCDWDRYEKTENDYCSWAKRREDD